MFSYFAEVLAREKRGEHLSWLCMFWMIGGIYASAMAWAIIPHYGKGPAMFQLLSPSASAPPRALAWGQYCPRQVSATHNALHGEVCTKTVSNGPLGMWIEEAGLQGWSCAVRVGGHPSSTFPIAAIPSG